MKPLAVATALFCLAAPVAHAGPIESACLRYGGDASSPALCGCIQHVADMTLQSSDQRRAATFFADPDKAQTVRMSKSDSDNAFWARYTNFGSEAEAVCAN